MPMNVQTGDLAPPGRTPVAYVPTHDRLGDPGTRIGHGPTAVIPPDNDDDFGGIKPLSLERMKRQYSDYLGAKSAEMDEMRLARAYFHGSQWTKDEIKKLNDRGQPVVTYNRIKRKINGVVGVIEKLRQDPRAYPRSPNGQDGAEIGTHVLNYVLDANEWRALSPDAALKGSVEGIFGIEINIEPGDHGDPDITIEGVDPRNFYYDPRSTKADFSDARFMGVAKWVDTALAMEMFPDKAEELRGYIGSSNSVGLDSQTGDDERDVKWVSNTRDPRLRLVEHWYKRGGQWLYCYFCGELVLAEGLSPFKDEKGKTFCRFIMSSNSVDQDDDRYGFFRDMKAPQDEVNHRRSKALHVLNSRRIIMEEGAVSDPERMRIEAAKADGVVVVNPGGLRFEFDDAAKNVDAQGNLEMLKEAKDEMDQFGPNPSLLGDAAAGTSGRALAMLQQAGIAELGSFILRYRAWKINVYRAIWNAVRAFWVAERWIRVTDSEDMVQFIQINGIEHGPMGPQMVNALGALDVDIILDEGPDQVNSMADAFDTLISLAQSTKMQIPPQVILELSSLPSSVKKNVLGQLQQANTPDPMKAQANQLEMQNKAADTAHRQAQAEHQHVLAAREAVGTHLDVVDRAMQAIPAGPPPMAPQMLPLGG